MLEGLQIFGFYVEFFVEGGERRDQLIDVCLVLFRVG